MAGIQGDFHQRAREVEIIRAYTVVTYSMWPAALVAIALQWRTLGRVATPAVLAFSPFVVILVQAYGGEAIYRVFLFSAPWCALLIAGMLAKLRPALWRLATACVCTVIFAAGLQGSFMQVAARRVHSTGTRSEPMAIWPCPSWLVARAAGRQLSRS